MNRVILKDVWEKYRIKFIKGGHVFWKEHWALRGIDFTLQEHETVGVLGKNGAGKTTLLKVIAGIFAPDKGEREVRGRIASLFDLGAGLSPELSGTENIIHNIRSYGIEKERIGQKIQEIAHFSQIGEFIDAPLKYYSSGMYARLAFALALSVEPDIFLIDDVLMVGDSFFQAKSLKKIAELREKNCSVMMVSHDMEVLKSLCDRVVVIDEGRSIYEGTPEEAADYYFSQRELSASDDKKTPVSSGGIRIPFLSDAYFSLSFHLKTPVSEKNYPSTIIRENGTLKVCFPGILLECTVHEQTGPEASEFSLIPDRVLTQPHKVFCCFELNKEHLFIEELIAGSERVNVKEVTNASIPLTEQNLDEIAFKTTRGFVIFRVPGAFYSVLVREGNLCLTIALMHAHCTEKEALVRVQAEFKHTYVPCQSPSVSTAIGSLCSVAQENSKVNLYAKGERLSSGLGVYFSFKKDGIWFDSCQSKVKAVRKNPHVLEIQREWYFFNICQKEYYTVEGNRVSVRMVAQPLSPLTNCVLFHCACMVTPHYDSYVFDRCGGMLADEFSSRYASSPYVYLNLPAAKPLLLSAQDLPSLTVEIPAGQYNFVLENSDLFYRSRIIKIEQMLESGTFTDADIVFSITVG